MADYDVIIIGANTPALVCAAYLGKLAGLKALILEKSRFIGATAQTREMVPGFKFHPAATGEFYVDHKVESELELSTKHGLQMIPCAPGPYLTTTFGDGKYLSLYSDLNKTVEEIGKFSKKDAGAYIAFVQKWGKVAQFFGMAQLNEPPPFSKLVASMSVNPEMEALLRDFLFATPKDVLDREFENDYVKAGFLTLHEGASNSPSSAAFFFNLARILMPWGFVKGGMNAVAQSLTKAAEAHGATIRTGSEVVKILVKDGKAYGVKTAAGEEITASTVVSELEWGKTFFDLVGSEHVKADFLQKVKGIVYECSAVTFNLALSELPDFGFPEDRYRGFFGVTTPDFYYMEEAYGHYKAGRIPERVCSMTYLPSYIEPDFYAPPGKHVLTAAIFPTPYKLREGNWETRKEEFKERIINTYSMFSPNIKQSVIACDGYSPLELERLFGMTNGDLGHGSYRWIQELAFRPIPGWSNYRSPISNLYMAGQATHPCSGVGGIGGHNVAKAIIADRESGTKK